MGGAAGGAVAAVGALISAVTLAYLGIDRMVNSLAQANQQMITFQRTTGINFSSLNKYASANAAVNFNSSIEGTAQSMQRLSQNLWDIQMGRGDISPYQELAFVGGKAFNPVGMSVEQVIESVRDAIKGVNDLQATNIITRMGFAPDDLMMLRMSREEFEKISDLFLSPQKREEMNKYGLELKKVQLEFQKINQLLTIDFAKPFLAATRYLQKAWNAIYKLVIKPITLGFEIIYKSIKGIVQFSQEWIRAMANAFGILKPILAIFRAIYLIFEDLATYYTGGDSVFGDFLEGLSGIADRLRESFKIEPPAWAQKIISWLNSKEVVLPNANGEYMSYLGDRPSYMSPINTNKVSNSGNINTNNNFTINSNQPITTITRQLTNAYTPTQAQLVPAGL